MNEQTTEQLKKELALWQERYAVLESEFFAMLTYFQQVLSESDVDMARSTSVEGEK